MCIFAALKIYLNLSRLQSVRHTHIFLWFLQYNISQQNVTQTNKKRSNLRQLSFGVCWSNETKAGWAQPWQTLVGNIDKL